MLRIRFGFVKLNTSKKKIIYMLIREEARFIRLTFPSSRAHYCGLYKNLTNFRELEAEN